MRSSAATAAAFGLVCSALLVGGDARADGSPRLDVANYTLKASLDPAAHTLHGEGAIEFTNTSSVAISEVWVHLYLNAFKNQRSVFMRDPVGGFRGSTVPKTWGAIDVRRFAQRTATGPVDLWPRVERSRPGDDDETDARLPLAAPLAPGATVTFDVVWDDTLPTIVERVGFSGSFHFLGQWFPKLARLEPDGTFAHYAFHHLAEFHADFGTYDVTVDVPKGFVVGATGPATESRDEGPRHIERHVQPAVLDFAFAAFDGFERLDEAIDGVQVAFLFPRGYRGAAERERAAVRFALPHFRERYGRYPYPTLTVVHPPLGAREAGGMEYPTLITTGGAWYGPPFVRELELVTIHELGHQYFFHLLASNEERWPFLDEGLNSYAEADALDAWLGPRGVASVLGLDVSDTTVALFSGRAHARVEPIAQPARAFSSGRAYGGLVYGRTSTLLSTLRRVYGEEKLTAALRAYATRFWNRHPEPEDLLVVLGEALGADARALARAALFDQGTIDYAVTQVASSRRAKPAGLFDRNGKRETDAAVVGDQYDGYAFVEVRGTLAFPVDVTFVHDDGGETRVRIGGALQPAGRVLRVPYTGQRPLKGVVVDPEHTVLLDDDFTNNHAMVADAPRAPQPRVFALATTLAAHLYSWLSP
ncbi:MAG: M1 family metallopeptidase [Myxococcales bacterium]|nr:M1 family metallopeptidase [Myxococcales bacterium]